MPDEEEQHTGPGSFIPAHSEPEHATNRLLNKVADDRNNWRSQAFRARRRQRVTLWASLAAITVAVVFGGIAYINGGIQDVQTLQHNQAKIVDYQRRLAEQSQCRAEANSAALAAGLHLELDLVPFAYGTPVDQASVARSTAAAQTSLAQLEGIQAGVVCPVPKAPASGSAFAPLGPYRKQRVDNRVEGVKGPAMHYGDTTTIRGTLCSKKRVHVLTTISWQAVGRTGTFVTAAVDVPQLREAGCHDFTFHNPMPTQVVSTQQVFAAEGSPAAWVVNGYEVPIVNGQQGAREPFTSEPFAIVPS